MNLRTVTRVALAAGVAVFAGGALTACYPSDFDVACEALGGTPGTAVRCANADTSPTRRAACSTTMQVLGRDDYYCWTIH